MAYTKIHAIKATVNKAIKYITNPDKTDGKMLVDSYACSPESADMEFDFTLKKTLTNSPNKAFHLIQSFMPGEVSYDEAHKIGQELADRLLEGKYSYVIATHIDHDHIHNHIVFCAADNINHKKYDDNKRSYYHIRELSDKLCAEHNLSIIKPGPKRGMKYNEWATRRDGTSWKAKVQEDIDATIKIAKSYENFIDIMRAKGYEIKGEEFGEGAAKYIAFKPLEAKNFVRGSDRAFGPGYTKENIRDRIQENLKEQSKNKVPFPTRPKKTDAIKTKTIDDIIRKPPRDLTKEPRYHYTDPANSDGKKSPLGMNIQNLKAAAHAYTIIENIKDIEAQIEEKKELIKTTKSSLSSLEEKMKTAGEILHFAEMYRTNLRYHNAMERSKDPDRYYREHDAEINLFNAAEHVLKDKYGINPQKMNYKNMVEGYQLMENKKSTLISSWNKYAEELHELESNLETMQSFMEQGGAESMQSHVHEENHEEEHIQNNQFNPTKNTRKYL